MNTACVAKMTNVLKKVFTLFMNWYFGMELFTSLLIFLNQTAYDILMYVISADCVEEIDAQRVLGYAIFKDGKDTKVSYPLENFQADVAGRSFHNGRFIQRMRKKAASLPKYVIFFFGNGKFYFNQRT